MNNNNLNQNKSQDDVLHLGDSFAGAYLPEVSINAIESLIENDKFSTAMFEFNGISLVVTKSSTVSSINKDYLQQSKENYELYLNSDEGKKQTIEREKIQLEYQNKGKILLNSFDDSLTSEKSLTTVFPCFVTIKLP